MTDEFHCTNLGQLDSIALKPVVTSLGKGERAVAALPLEPGLAATLARTVALDESLKGHVDPLHHVLKNLGMDLFVPRAFTFQWHQRPLLTVVVGLFPWISNTCHQRASIDWAAVHFPPVETICQQPVVLMPQHIEPVRHLASLFISWLQSVLVGSFHRYSLISVMIITHTD